MPGSGRAKGTPNRRTVQTRERIQELADPIQFLADVMAGRRMTAAGEPGQAKRTWVYPTLAQRVQAGETLLRKLLPDLRATELTGKDGAPVIEQPTRRVELMSTLDTAMHLGLALRMGEEAKKELAELDESTTDTEPELILEPEAPSKPVKKPEAPPVEPAEPSLPKHAYVYIEEGARERSGTRAWLAMEGRDVLNTFHGADARQKARDWVGTKFGASPAEEIEVPLSEAVTQ